MHKQAVFISGIFLFFLLALEIGQADALRLTKLGGNQDIFNFEPNLVIKKTWAISDSTPGFGVGVKMEGDLTQYATYSLKDSVLEVTIKLPDALQGGEYFIHPVAEEIPSGSGSGTVGTSVTIRPTIKVVAPFVGFYAVIDTAASDVNEGEDITLRATISNKGDEEISAYTAIDVFQGDEKLESVKTETVDVPLFESKNMVSTINPGSKFRGGKYKAVFTVFYKSKKTGAEKKEVLERGFNIGTLNIKINSFTGALVKDGIQEFAIDIESTWFSKISNIFGEASISSEAMKEPLKIKTPSSDLNAKERKNITAFIDTSKLELGEYTAAVAVNYEGKRTEKSGKLTITGKLEKIEEPKKSPFPIDPIYIAAIVIILIITITIFKVLKH